jgi:hypothetical protein
MYFSCPTSDSVHSSRKVASESRRAGEAELVAESFFTSPAFTSLILSIMARKLGDAEAALTGFFRILLGNIPI